MDAERPAGYLQITPVAVAARGAAEHSDLDDDADTPQNTQEKVCTSHQDTVELVAMRDAAVEIEYDVEEGPDDRQDSLRPGGIVIKKFFCDF